MVPPLLQVLLDRAPDKREIRVRRVSFKQASQQLWSVRIVLYALSHQRIQSFISESVYFSNQQFCAPEPKRIEIALIS